MRTASHRRLDLQIGSRLYSWYRDQKIFGHPKLSINDTEGLSVSAVERYSLGWMYQHRHSSDERNKRAGKSLGLDPITLGYGESVDPLLNVPSSKSRRSGR